MIIGSDGVGKSTILHQYIEKTEFQSISLITIGVEFKTKIITTDGQSVKLLLSDIAGHEKFAPMRQTYFTGAAGCVVVYDITDRHSFEAVDKWFEEFLSTADKSIPLTLVGNKIDLANERQITFNEGATKAEEKGASFFETSAKTGTLSIDELFEDLAKRKLQIKNNFLEKTALKQIDSTIR
ncbi:MAG: Rab family GTPase [Promethearchaeota archaeon]